MVIATGSRPSLVFDKRSSDFFVGGSLTSLILIASRYFAIHALSVREATEYLVHNSLVHRYSLSLVTHRLLHRTAFSSTLFKLSCNDKIHLVKFF